MKELAWMWLAQGLGYGVPNSGKVLEAYDGDVQAVLADVGGLALRSVFTRGQAARLAGTRPEEYAPLLERIQAEDIRVVCYADEEYPELLRQIYNPPPVLYVKGDVGLLSAERSVAIVGARNPSRYGVDAVAEIGSKLAKQGVVIVSGLAAGLDAEAHKAALSVSGKTVACIAFGHDLCYPAANRVLLEIIERYGAVVSEYPLGQRADKPFFLQRNRIIAGLAGALVVAEAKRHSSTMSTVNFAQDWGRDVFAVPGSIFSELSQGTNGMIQEGAYLAASAEDILAQYGWGGEEKPADAPPKAGTARQRRDGREAAQQPPADAGSAAPAEMLADVSEEARLAYTQLSTQPKGLAELCEDSGLGPGIALAAMSELEMAGLAKQLPGRKFTVVH